MRELPRGRRGFTLVELIAAITIVAILAAVSLPRLTAASPSFAARGFADGVAAALRQARAVAFASGCDVQFTVDANGYRAFQRAASGTHCATGGAFSTPVQNGAGSTLNELRPAGAVLAANRQFIFSGADGSVAGGPFTINIATQAAITVDASGVIR
jgi:prepilin-type N-terminal cleavage/methylation domain-containing protein